MSTAMNYDTFGLDAPTGNAKKPIRRIVAVLCGVVACAALATIPTSGRFTDTAMIEVDEADCEPTKDLAYFTLISTRETTLHKIKDHDDGFTYFKIELGPDNLAALAAVRGEDGDSDLYSSIKTKRFFDNWIYGFVEDGRDQSLDQSIWCPISTLICAQAWISTPTRL